MSSASSAVTYTSVYTDSEPWRFQWVSNDELEAPEEALPSHEYVPGPEHPLSPDYVPGPEHPHSPVYVPYVPEPEYPEYLVPYDTEALIEDQPLPADASPTSLSSSYITDSDPNEDLEEDPEEDPADYPTDGGDDADDEYDDDDDDDDVVDEDREDDEKKEEHLALTYCANNELTVLNHSPLFDGLLDDVALVVPFEVNEVTFQKAFVKSFTVARDERNAVFKLRQESARKEVERAFGVLQGRWHIIAQPARAWTVNKLRRIILNIKKKRNNGGVSLVVVAVMEDCGDETNWAIQEWK
nr:hypothetical protein [Tanacetum cinerariifolium]